MSSLGHRIQKEILRSSLDDKGVFAFLPFSLHFNLLDRKHICLIKAGIKLQMIFLHLKLNSASKNLAFVDYLS